MFVVVQCVIYCLILCGVIVLCYGVIGCEEYWCFVVQWFGCGVWCVDWFEVMQQYYQFVVLVCRDVYLIGCILQGVCVGCGGNGCVLFLGGVVCLCDVYQIEGEGDENGCKLMFFDYLE